MSAEQPLLQSVSTHPPNDNPANANSLNNELTTLSSLDYQDISTSTFNELWIIFKISFPIFLSVFCEWMPELIAFIIIGHSIDSATNLSIVALSYTFYNFILFIIWGLLSGLYTLIQDVYKRKYRNPTTQNTNGNASSSSSSSYSATDHHDNSNGNVFRTRTEYYIQLYSQRAFIITLIVSVPFMILLSYGGTILVYLGINPAFGLNVNFVCMELIGTLYIEIWRSILQRITESIQDGENNVNKSLFYCNLCAALLSFPVSWFFILFLDLGFKGFAIVIAICNAFNLLLIVILLYCKDYGYIFKPLSLYKLLNVKGLKQYLQLSLPGMFISLFEMSTSYLIILLCGFIDIKDGNAKYAVCAGMILMLIIRFIQFIFTGISYALSIRIDGYIYMQCLGTGHNNNNNDHSMIIKAKEARNVGYLMMIIVNIIISITLYFGKYTILSIFINNEIVIDLINGPRSYLMDILIIHSFIMSFEYLLSSICRGIGEPYSTYPAQIILCSYYFVPFPLMLVSLFYFGYQYSLYQGLEILFALYAFSKLITVAIMQLMIWCRIDWKRIAQKRYKKATKSMQLQIVDLSN